MRVGAGFSSNGLFMERDTPGLEAALPAPTLIREDRTQPGKCYDSFSSTRSHSKKDKHNVSTDKRKFSGGAPPTRYGERALCRSATSETI